jgi:hypothetical protein
VRRAVSASSRGEGPERGTEEHEPFPLRAIRLATRAVPDAAVRATVAELHSDTEEGRSDRRHLGNLNVALLRSIAQHIDVGHVRPLDIDHIYASALASRMHVSGNRRMHHLERWRVNTIGNMWLLDAGTNHGRRGATPAQARGASA